MFKADTPQRDQNTRHLGVGASEKCNKCPCPGESVWDEKYDIPTLRYRVGVHETITAYKNEIGNSSFEGTTSIHGFTGELNLFRGLDFCPFRQGPVEPYHCLLLGLVKLFIGPTLGCLPTERRDFFQILLKKFPFPRGVPAITFKISIKKSYSMTIFSQVAHAFPYILINLDASSLLIQFWAKLSKLIQGVFNPKFETSQTKVLQQLYQEILRLGKQLFPNFCSKHFPNNIHSGLELLFSDLVVFGNGILIGAQAEENRHSPLKKGLHFTNHRDESVVTILKVDNALQFLKYLIHRSHLDSSDLNLKEIFYKTSEGKWNNSILEEFCPSSLSLPLVRPKKFCYTGNRHRAQVDSTIPNKEEIMGYLGQNLIDGWAQPSKQVQLGDQVYEIDDSVKIGNDQHEFIKIREILTVKSKQGQKTFFRRFYYIQKGYDENLAQNFFSLSPILSKWLPAERLIKVIAAHHRCDRRCTIKRTCLKHSQQSCPLACGFYDLTLTHSDTHEFVVDPNFRLLV